MFGYWNEKKAVMRVNETLKTQVEDLQDQNQNLADLNAKIRQEKSALEAQLKACREARDTLIETNKELNGKLREQTRADILFNALQAVGVIPKRETEKVDTAYLDRQIELGKQLAAYNSNIKTAWNAYGEAPSINGDLAGIFGGRLI